MGKTKKMLVIIVEYPSTMTQGNNTLIGTKIGIRIMNESLPTITAPTSTDHSTMWLAKLRGNLKPVPSTRS